MSEAGTNSYKYLRSGKVEALNNSVKFRQQEATTVQALQTLWQLITTRLWVKVNTSKDALSQTQMQTQM